MTKRRPADALLVLARSLATVDGLAVHHTAWPRALSSRTLVADEGRARVEMKTLAATDPVSRSRAGPRLLGAYLRPR